MTDIQVPARATTDLIAWFGDLSKADVPGKPMSLTELATLMKTDHDKLTAVVKASKQQ